MSDEAIGIRELKNRLSAVLRRVRQGRTVTIKDRKEPVAVLVPAPKGDDSRLLEQLAKTGRLSWSGGKPVGCKKPPRVRGAPVSDAVLEGRR